MLKLFGIAHFLQVSVDGYEIVEKRKSLIPIMKRALNNKKRAVLKVDKLYIDGTLYEGEAEADSDDEDDTGETGTQIVGDDEEET